MRAAARPKCFIKKATDQKPEGQKDEKNRATYKHALGTIGTAHFWHTAFHTTRFRDELNRPKPLTTVSLPMMRRGSFMADGVHRSAPDKLHHC